MFYISIFEIVMTFYPKNNTLQTHQCGYIFIKRVNKFRNFFQPWTKGHSFILPINTSRYFWAMLVVLSLAFILTMQVAATEQTPSKKFSENDLKHVNLQLVWLHQFQFAGYYAALEKGFYREAGFKVTISEGGPGRSPVNEVISGRASYGVGKGEILLHRLHGKPVVAIAVIFQHSAIILLAKKESGIDNPQRMIGRRVMRLKGDDAAEDIAMFRKEGISLEQINIIPSTYDIKDLIDDKVDVFNAYITNEPYFLKVRSIPVSIISPRTYGIDFYGDCLFTSEQELKEHPKQVKAFREASLRGWEYAMAHPEEIVDLIKKSMVLKNRKIISCLKLTPCVN